ncbi:MAG: pantoate--beta-alanine ligase [Flavobacteriaceae bacterium]|nr:pantoate--beta-alanine ligase [Flavobacteriaceae bacterium]
MIIFNNIVGFKNHLRKLKNDNITIGFVPTMGALHNGHTSLIKKSVLENDYSVVSIFINPTQFNNINDYESYPINISRDIELLDSISENIILFRPDTEEIYSGKVVSDSYDFGDLDKYMEGEHRKGHFQGVATVVNKLFQIVSADNVYFGEKDFQQLRIIEHLVQKNGYKFNVIRCKTIRQNDGLALSSRNKKLDISSQNIATNLFKALSFAKKNFDTLDLEIIYAKVEDLLQNFPQISVDYFAIADENDLKPIKHKNKNQKYRAFIAADISGVRLIDNIKLY